MAIRSKRYVIVGNGVAGTTAAEHLKKGDPTCQVTLIGEERYPLYNRVALPPFLKGAVAEEKVLMRSVADHREKGIDLRLGTRVITVDGEARIAVTDEGTELPFDKLLIATGGRARDLPARGVEGTKYVYNFQTLDDTKEIIARFNEARTAAVIGGSFIAYELAEGFRARGLSTTWIIRGPRFLRRILDEDGGRLVDQIARRHGVRVLYHEEVGEVLSSGGAVKEIITKSGVRVEADLVGTGLGLALNTEIAQLAGATVEKGIRTDSFLRTSVPGILAAGDVAEFYDKVVESHHAMGTWNNSVSHGKVAAENMLGAEEPYKTVPTYTSGLFDSKLAVMGTTPEISDRVEGVSTCDFENLTYRRLFFIKEQLVGAVLIGDMSPRRQILKLIRGGDAVSNRASLLAVT